MRIGGLSKYNLLSESTQNTEELIVEHKATAATSFTKYPSNILTGGSEEFMIKFPLLAKMLFTNYPL